MNILDSKTNNEIHQSLLAEIAKASNELKCAQADLKKATSRLTFCIAAVNEMLLRDQDRKEKR